MNVTLEPSAEAYLREKLAADESRSVNEIINEAVLTLKARASGWKEQVKVELEAALRGDLLSEDQLKAHLRIEKRLGATGRRTGG